MGFNNVTKIDDAVPIRNAIVSVYDKSGLAELVDGLLECCPGIRFYATGGSYAFLRDRLSGGHEGRLVALADYTGQPEMKGGLVKSLDWKIYLGLLAEPYDADHEADLADHGAVAFDLVVGNLYPFKAAAASAKRFEDARQHIDIGGPSMLRAAAKNFIRVAPLPSPELYGAFLAELRRGSGALRLDARARLAAEVFRRQSEYDAAVAAYIASSADTVLKSSYT